MGLRMKNFKFLLGGSLKNPNFRGERGGGHEKQIYRGLAKKGGLGQSADLRKGVA